jgi:hypothetical protein
MADPGHVLDTTSIVPSVQHLGVSFGRNDVLRDVSGSGAAARSQ